MHPMPDQQPRKNNPSRLDMNITERLNQITVMMQQCQRHMVINQSQQHAESELYQTITAGIAQADKHIEWFKNMGEKLETLLSAAAAHAESEETAGEEIMACSGSTGGETLVAESRYIQEAIAYITGEEL